MRALNVGVNDAIVPELDCTCMIRDDVGVELILGTLHSDPLVLGVGVGMRF